MIGGTKPRPGAHPDENLMRRAAQAAGIQVALGETLAGKPALMELDDGSSLTRVYNPLEQSGRVIDLITILGLAVAVNLEERTAYAGTMGVPDGEHNPVRIKWEGDDKDARNKALARAVVTAAAARCE